eukprot:10691059-Heterocapsa_arctica.AAC.1
MCGRGRHVPHQAHNKIYTHQERRHASYDGNWENGCNAACAAWNMACEAGVIAEQDLPTVED